MIAASLGSMGLLKMQPQRWATLQCRRKNDWVNPKDALSAFKPSKILHQTERAILDGEAERRASLAAVAAP